jgi:hypothetical protein
VAGLALLSTSCSQFLREATAPECEGEFGEASLVLVAQSVPTARLVPCIAGYPTGWTYTGMEVRSGRSEYDFDHDRAGADFLQVILTEECDLTGAEEIHPDEEGAERYEVVDQVVGQFQGAWMYVFDGGCVTYRFDFDEGDPALQIESAVAIDFVTRDQLNEIVEQDSDGDLHLRDELTE